MTTTQLDAEEKHIEQFETNICPQYGIKPILDWGTGSENKKSNCDADRTVQIINLEKFNKLKCKKKYKLGYELTVSLKTEKGNFTIANGGTGLNSSLFKCMILPNHTNAINEFKRRKLEIRQYQEELGKNNRWVDVGQSKKLYIKQQLVELLWLLFNVPPYREKLYEWLSERQSDLKCVGDKLFVPEKKILPELCEPKFCGDDTVIVGHYKLRVKAAGGKVGTSWKINYQINQE
tara:strand:+ start:145 stop:846 length:702 start_codon:yes stop_codon:yes gene_type:complete